MCAFSEELLAEGRAEGRMEGEAKGRAEGEAKGRAEGEAKGRAEGEAKGRAEGRAEGKIEGIVESAVGMIKDRMSAKLIMKYTQLPLEKIQELAASIGVAVVI